SGTLKVLSFRNTRNGLVLPVHIVSRKGDVLKRGAQECIGLLTESRVSAGN
ncbi:TPA: LysR family transcriptional regulator, partial [Escherichia coli]|nr:LysR family transcriptional regulator [Escherichia coli]